MTNKNSNDLIITRIFDAPVERVWKAWTEPKEVKNWWGPKYFTSPVIKIDLREGGTSLYCMRSPEGQDYWSTGVYKEIVPFKRIVSTDSFADKEGNIVPASKYGIEEDWPLELLVTVTFERQEGKTKFKLRHEGIPEGENRDLTEAGWNESLDKLSEYLESNK